MTNELQQALADLLTKANNGIDTASDFLVAELPEVTQQLLQWYGLKSFIVFLLCIIVPFVMYKINVAIFTKLKNDDTFLEENPHIALPLVFIDIVIVIVCLVNINLTWLQIWVAPKIWLIEYTSKLVG